MVRPPGENDGHARRQGGIADQPLGTGAPERATRRQPGAPLFDYLAELHEKLYAHAAKEMAEYWHFIDDVWVTDRKSVV
jgi:hypothetical protein